MMSKLPLTGKTIFIPRSGKQGMVLSERIADLGGRPYRIPLIEFREGNDLHDIKYINRLSLYDWIIFTSQNGVKYFFNKLNRIKKVIPLTTRIAAIGEKTRDSLELLGYQVDFIPKKYSADHFAQEFIETGFKPNRVLLPKGNLARDIIAKSLVSRNCMVDEWIVYETFFPNDSKRELIRLLNNVQLDFAMFTSPSTVHHFMQAFRELENKDNMKKLKMISIGPVTKKAIESYGWVVSASPENYSVENMLDCLCNLNAMEEEL